MVSLFVRASTYIRYLLKILCIYQKSSFFWDVKPSTIGSFSATNNFGDEEEWAEAVCRHL